MCIRVSFVRVHLNVRFLGLNKGTNGDTWQTYVGLWGSAEVDGVTVQANVLKSIADVIQVMWIAEGVLMHHLDIVILNEKTENDFNVASRKFVSVH